MVEHYIHVDLSNHNNPIVKGKIHIQITENMYYNFLIMGELITLTCPSCGGKLQVSPNTSVLICQHCGIEHLVRRDSGGVSLESFARCPKCGRNDKVEKISAILRSHSREVTTTEKQTAVRIDQKGKTRTETIEVPVTHTQVTGLAQSFIHPGEKPNPLPKPASIPKPKLPSRPRLKSPKSKKTNLLLAGILLIITTICVLGFFVAGLVNEPNIEIAILCILPMVFILLGGIIILVLGIKKKPISQEELELIDEENNQKLKDWEEEKLSILDQWENNNKRIIDKWNEDNWLLEESWRKAVENWNNLYYCYRDDCVFVQGDDQYAPIDEMGSYLYKDLPKPKIKP